MILQFHHHSRERAGLSFFFNKVRCLFALEGCSEIAGFINLIDYFTLLKPAAKFSKNAGHSMNSPLKVGNSMVNGLMGCWIMIGSDVDAVEENEDPLDGGDIGEVIIISISWIISCTLSNSFWSSLRFYVLSVLRVDKNWSIFLCSAGIVQRLIFTLLRTCSAKFWSVILSSPILCRRWPLHEDLSGQLCTL